MKYAGYEARAEIALSPSIIIEALCGISFTGRRNERRSEKIENYLLHSAGDIN